MSANGDSTRDWLLKKLLKASGVLKEQEVSLKLVSAERDSLSAENLMQSAQLSDLSNQLQSQRNLASSLREQRNSARESRDEYRRENSELRRRVRSLSPDAQFKIMYQPDAYGTQFKPIQLAIESVESANGKTTIRTRWPQNVELQPIVQPLQFANTAITAGWDNTEEYQGLSERELKENGIIIDDPINDRSPALDTQTQEAVRNVFNGPHGCS